MRKVTIVFFLFLTCSFLGIGVGTTSAQGRRPTALALAITPQGAPPTDLAAFSYRRLTGTSIELYLNQWGAGYVHDIKNNAWLPIPQGVNISIQPAYCKASNTMALIYGGRGMIVYDSGLYVPTNPGHAWVSNNSNQGAPFYSFSRSATANYAAQLNDNMALAVGTSWMAVYDRPLHRWLNHPGGADDSTGSLSQYMVLNTSIARVKILNGPFCTHPMGSNLWQCQ
jgi:hypothetical protein